jgi:acyl carrier protein phosphodiesterase
MQVIQISYNQKTDNTTLVFTKGYQQADRVTQLDLLQDAIYELQKQYDELLKNG